MSFEPLEGAWVIRLVAKTGIPNNSSTVDDDLDWPELEYESLSPKCVGEATVEFKHRGRLNARAFCANYPEVVLAY